MAKDPKHTWYVSFGVLAPRYRATEHYSRKTNSFLIEADAKKFARQRLSEGLNVAAGTLNPHLPKRTISSAQINDWLEEPGSLN
jgi:hypothetical protein